MRKLGLWSFLAALGTVAPLHAQTALLPAAGDSYLKSGSPNQNQGSETVLRIQSSGQNRALVQFDPAAIQAAVSAGSLASARLELFIAFNSDNWGTDGRTVDAHRLTQTWTEAGVTWNCPVDTIPTNGSPNCATQWAGGSFAEEPSDTVLHTNGLGGWVGFDVSADVQALLAGSELFGWLVKKSDEGQNGRVDYASKEAAAANRPRLVLVVESATHDEVLPRLAITSPNQPVLVNPPSLAIELAYTDGGMGVNPASLEVRLDGAVVSCTAGPASATCPVPNTAAGAHTISAQLADHAGNVATANSSFELLAGPGLHSLRLPVVSDTYLRQGSANQNQGGEPILRLQQSGKNRALLAVDPSQATALLAGATVRSARLELSIAENGNNWGSTGRTIDLYRTSAAWTEIGATWNCADDLDPTNQQPNCATQWNGGSVEPAALGSLVVANGLGGMVGFDVTADLAAITSGAAHHGWLLRKREEGQSGRVEFSAREAAADLRPVVVVVFETEEEEDTEPPLIMIDAPADGSLLSTLRPEVRAGYSDAGSGIDATSVRFYLDGVDRSSEASISGNGLTFQPPEALFEGVHQVALVVWDNALNVEQAAWTFQLDATPPRITILSPAVNQRVHQAEVELSGKVEDGGGVAGVSVNGSPVPITGDDFSATVPLSEGSNLLRITAVDLAGNSSEEVIAVERFTLPEVRITTPADLSTEAATTVRVSGSVSTGVVQVSVNGVSAQVAALAFEALDVPLLEGGNILTASAVDGQGRMVTDSVSVVRDLTPPRLALYYPRDGASIFGAEAAVSGLVNDIVPGTVNASEVTVTVNGRPAEISNRSFLLASLPLEMGANVLEVAATDEAGNTARVEAVVHRVEASGRRIAVVSGGLQVGVIGAALEEPFVVELRDALGQPVPGSAVLFKVRGGEGSLDDGARQVAVSTNGSGRALVRFTLGGRAGVGNQVVEASAVGFSGPARLVATALAAEPSLVVVDSGDQQVGVAGRKLPRPLIAAVTDRGFNRLHGVGVRFIVVKGDGSFENGLSEIEVATESDGRALATLWLGAREGNAANVVEAVIAGLENGPAVRFVASGRAAGLPAETSISGVVLDNSDRQVPGVTLRVRDTLLTSETNEQGFFRISPAPVGSVHLLVDGSTAQAPGAWPDLEFLLTTVPGRDNNVGMPIYLVPLALDDGIYVDETRGGTLTIPEMPGFSVEILPGSVVFPGGGRSGVVSATLVHSDKVPMVPNFGQQPRFIVTIQPAGARFEPPASMTLPNVEGLPPGSVTEFYSFDHDLGHFVSIGPATVSEDGLLIVSNPGVGLVKAGWHCGGNPAFAGTPHDCPECERCVGGSCEPLPQGSACEDDGDACTQDVCQGGGCFHRPVECPECKKCDGGDCVADARKNGRSCGGQEGMVCQNGECVCATPVRMVEIERGHLPFGELFFRYSWESSTGRLGDLADCQVGEVVVYPGAPGSDFVWPRPWARSNPNVRPRPTPKARLSGHGPLRAADPIRREG